MHITKQQAQTPFVTCALCNEVGCKASDYEGLVDQLLAFCNSTVFQAHIILTRRTGYVTATVARKMKLKWAIELLVNLLIRENVTGSLFQLCVNFQFICWSGT